MHKIRCVCVCVGCVRKRICRSVELVVPKEFVTWHSELHFNLFFFVFRSHFVSFQSNLTFCVLCTFYSSLYIFFGPVFSCIFDECHNETIDMVTFTNTHSHTHMDSKRPIKIENNGKTIIKTLKKIKQKPSIHHTKDTRTMEIV